MPIQAQLVELNAALADLVEHSATGEISATLAEMLEVMKAHKASVIPAPQVTVKNYVTVQAVGHKVHIEYDSMNRACDFTVTPITKGA